MKTLVVGCDASGKTTFLDSVVEKYGDTLGEMSRSVEARTFKKNNLDRPVDADFINQREQLYLNLSHQALMNINQSVGNVITTDVSLVTRLAHNTMRDMIGVKSLDDEEIINEWQNDEKLANASSLDIIVFTHAPFTIIRNRIYQRQQAGRFEEKFWGFNSPYFLESYQERWHKIINRLSETAFTCLSVDTTKITPSESIKKYDIIRQPKAN
jgi:uncharacterized protein (UPF0297 family)